jgi:hypothetical protein
MQPKKHPLYYWITVYPDGRIQSSRGFFKPRIDKKRGYCRIVIQSTKKGILRNTTFHRLVAETFIPNPKNKTQVHHIDGDKLNNSVSNLEWVTKSEHDKIHNNERIISGRVRMLGNTYSKGIGKKLHPNDVKKIKELFLSISNNAEIARQFNVSRKTISQIRNGIIWKTY